MSQQQPIHPLITDLQSKADDRAMLAELRRGLGRLPGEAPSMFPYIVPFSNNRYEEKNLYMIAALFALHPVSAQQGNMGTHLQSYVTSIGDDVATTRRFTQLLNLRGDELDNPLRQHISMLKSKDIPVNWHQLIYDLNHWNHSSRFVQKNWAKSYWR